MKTKKCKCGSENIIVEMKRSIIRVYCEDCGNCVETIPKEEEPERESLPCKKAYTADRIKALSKPRDKRVEEWPANGLAL